MVLRKNKINNKILKDVEKYCLDLKDDSKNNESREDKQNNSNIQKIKAFIIKLNH